MSFKNFTLTEAAKAKHALRFMEYEQKEHSALVNKVKAELVKEWTRIISKYEPLEDDNTLEGRKAKILRKMEIDNSNAKVGRFNKSTVSPSVKVGNAYSQSQQEACQKALMAVALKVLKKHASKLNTDLRGNPFYASQDDGALGDIRLKFKTGDYKKTIMFLSIEDGYNFDRVYFRDFLK